MPREIYRLSRHSKTRLMIHVVFVTKYRKVLDATGIWEAIKQLIRDRCGQMDVNILEMGGDKDHIHMLLEYGPTQSISRIVSLLKQHSTYYLWKKYPWYLGKLYWKEKTLWSDGYFATSIGDASQEKTEEYIRNQG